MAPVVGTETIASGIITSSSGFNVFKSITLSTTFDTDVWYSMPCNNSEPGTCHHCHSTGQRLPLCVFHASLVQLTFNFTFTDNSVTLGSCTKPGNGSLADPYCLDKKSLAGSFVVAAASV